MSSTAIGNSGRCVAEVSLGSCLLLFRFRGPSAEGKLHRSYVMRLLLVWTSRAWVLAWFVQLVFCSGRHLLRFFAQASQALYQRGDFALWILGVTQRLYQVIKRHLI